MLPFWLALSASLALHVGALLSPGWALPFDSEPDPPGRFDARLTPPPPAQVASVVPPAPVRKKPSVAKPPVAALDIPVAEPNSGTPPESAETAADNALPAPPPAADPAPAEALAAAVAPVPEKGFPSVAPSYAGRWPRSGRIVFQVTRGEGGFIVGRAEHRWTHDGRQYRLQAVTETTGLVSWFRSAKVVQESKGGFDAVGLRPLEFTVQREGRAAESVRFAPGEGRIVLGSGASAPFAAETQDMLSLFYQLAEFPAPLDNLDLKVATVRGIAAFEVRAGANEALETPIGTRQAVFLKLLGGRQEDHTEVWLDAATRLPLRIRHRDRKGEIFDQVVQSIETEPNP